MSVYQKFIDSAGVDQVKQHAPSSTSSRDSALFANSPCLSSKQKQQLLAASGGSKLTSSKSAATSPAKGSLAMLRQQPTAMSNLHLPTLINSTPLTSKQQNQYKRLVEADYYSTSANSHHQQHFCQHHHNQQQQQQQQQQYQQVCHHRQIRQQQAMKARPMSPTGSVESILDTKDPVLRDWLRAMRFETELECLTHLQARTLAIDEPAAGALSVRNSQVAIQEMSLESNFLMDYLSHLIESLPLMFNTVQRFAIEFSELWTRLAAQTAAKVNTNQMQINSQQQQHLHSHLQQQQKQHYGHQNPNQLTIINCTPRKSAAAASARVTRPLDKLAARIRTICHECANLLCEYEANSCIQIDNAYLEASLMQLKQLYGQFVEISMRIECANIVQALDYDFSQSSLNRLSSSSSLQAVRPFESTSVQLPLKWALIALWQLTKNDSYLCRVLTEKWHTQSATAMAAVNCPPSSSSSPPSSKVAKRLDYSTKYDHTSSNHGSNSANSNNDDYASSLRSDYQKLYTQTMQNSGHALRAGNEENQHHRRSASGALSSALRTKQLTSGVKQVSPIELLIDIIISQPNKHERLDMMNLIHMQAQHDKLIDVDEWDQSVSAAIYTSNQYKVAALRILNHMCANDQAVKTILKCFSTPPPSQGQPMPENKIIRSIFECYQSSQEHIYQNETMFRATSYAAAQRDRKRTKYQQQQQQQHQSDHDEEYSDYGSRHTGNSLNDSIDESDDVVVKEAISLLVQLTTPFHRSQQGLDYYTLIGRFSIDSLVKYLTNIIRSTSSREMIFLSLTALANISFITTEPMKHYESNRVILNMFRAARGRSKDLELRDQAVTILANTADKNLLDIVSSGGLNFLLSCLESCPNRMVNYRSSRGSTRSLDDSLTSVVHIENRPGDRRPIGQFIEELPEALGCSCDQAESSLSGALPGGARMPIVSDCLARLSTADLSAMERIHQKTAVAFARMSVDPGVSRMILKHGGVKQLIDLCKFGQKRNHSDTVLIACIAALRKMSKVVDSETFKHYHALDLIQLDLNRTLEIYGNSRSVVEAQQKMFASDV